MAAGSSGLVLLLLLLSSSGMGAAGIGFVGEEKEREKPNGMRRVAGRRAPAGGARRLLTHLLDCLLVYCEGPGREKALASRR